MNNLNRFPRFWSKILVGLMIFFLISGAGLSRWNYALSSATPSLTIPSQIHAAPGSTVKIPVIYSGAGNQISAMVFSIDYDQAWLSLNPADSNSDGVPDAVQFNLSAAFSGQVSFDANDLTGELDFVIADFAPPLMSLADGTLVTVTLTVGSPTQNTLANVNFSQTPPASYGDVNGKSVSGSAAGGSVSIDVKPVAAGPIYLAMIQRFIPTPVTVTPSPSGTVTKTADPTTTTPSASPTTTTPVPTTVTPQPCGSIVTNGGFETSDAWVIPVTEFSAIYTTDKQHSGSRSLRAGIPSGGSNRYAYSSASQVVSISASAKSATLNFWYYTTSSEAASKPLAPRPTGTTFSLGPSTNDLQYVMVFDLSENLLTTLLWERSNSQSWNSGQYDLTAYKGQTVKLYFGTYNDGVGGVSAMYVDDVSLNVCK